jgi:hypothetical protein
MRALLVDRVGVSGQITGVTLRVDALSLWVSSGFAWDPNVEPNWLGLPCWPLVKPLVASEVAFVPFTASKNCCPPVLRLGGCCVGG